MRECWQCDLFRGNPLAARDKRGFCHGKKDEFHRKLDSERGGDWRSVINGSDEACSLFKERRVVVKLRPSPGRALVRVKIPEDVSPGGIALPVDREGDPKDNPTIGIVIDFGPPKDGTLTPDFGIGDRVLFTDFITTRPPGKDEDVYIVDFDDIAAVFEGEDRDEVFAGNEEPASNGPLDNKGI